MVGPAATRPSRAKGRVFPLEGLQGESKEVPLHGVRNCGIRPRHRRRLRARLGDPARRRSGDRQVDAAHAGVRRLAKSGHRVAYISGEEAVAQVRLRAERLGMADAPVELASETNVEDIVATSRMGGRLRLAIIDSIQTMWTETVDSAPGTVTQVRGSAQALIRFAKRSGTAVILVGHVTKDGQIAGPRVVEHMVDAVVLRGRHRPPFPHLARRQEPFRTHRRDRRVRDVRSGAAGGRKPLRAFLSARDLAAPGTAVFAGMEGTRPVLVEIQALVAPTSLGTPRRAVVGWDQNRLSMVLAVLEAHGGLRLGMHDVSIQRRRRPAHHRAGGGSRRCGGPRVVPLGRAAAARYGLFRRAGTFVGHPPGRSGTGAAEGSGEARVFPCRFRRSPARRTESACPCGPIHRAHHGPVAGVAGERPRQRAVGFRREGQRRSVLDIPLFEAPKG